MKSLLATLIATFFVGVTAHADVRIKPPATGPVDTTIGTRPPKRSPIPPGNPSIGRFEKEQRAKRFVAAALVNSGLDKLMKREQPKDLENLKKALVKGFLKDTEAANLIKEIAYAELPAKPSEREEALFDMQMNLTLLAGQFGYEEQDQ